MRACKQRQISRSKITVLRWFAAFITIFFTYWLVATNFVIRDFFDPQYSMKYGLLRDRIAENPGKPLWLVVGTSRTDHGLRPSLIENKTQTGGTPLIFNFGMSGSDLFRQYICIKRILKDGVKPQRIGIEILPPLLSQEESYFITTKSLVVRARWNELDDFRRFTASPEQMLDTWKESRSNPFYKLGFKADGQTLPTWRLIVPPSLLKNREASQHLDRWGWMKIMPASVTRTDYLKGLEIAREHFAPMLKDFKVTLHSELVMDELLELCEKSGIDVFLLLMPESADFRQIYPEQATPEIAAFLERAKKIHGVQIIDARPWIETEYFRDGHHLTATGAEKFTKRFAEELFKPAY